MNRTQLADAILKGKQTEGVKESQTAYVTAWQTRGICLACALGCALIGKLDGDYLEAERVFRAKAHKALNQIPVQVIFADILEISTDLAVEVEFRHLNNQSVEEIAAWLKKGDDQ